MRSAAVYPITGGANACYHEHSTSIDFGRWSGRTAHSGIPLKT